MDWLGSQVRLRDMQAPMTAMRLGMKRSGLGVSMIGNSYVKSELSKWHTWYAVSNPYRAHG